MKTPSKVAFTIIGLCVGFGFGFLSANAMINERNVKGDIIKVAPKAEVCDDAEAAEPSAAELDSLRVEVIPE
jgi:hypothetical protein